MKNSRLSAFPEDNPESRMVAYVVSFAGHVLAVTVPIAHWHLPMTRIFFFLKLPGSSRSWHLQLSFRSPSVRTDNFNSYPEGVQDPLMAIKHHAVE